MDMILRVAIIGFGNVGQEFARLLLLKREWLLKRKGLDVEVLAIATRSRGSLISKNAINLENVLRQLKDRGTLTDFGPETTKESSIGIIQKCDADLMIELTTLNIENGKPAIDHIKAAINCGMDVITANKGPIAFAYHELRDMARSKGVHLRFEGTVMDGTPIFNLVEKTLPGCEILGMEGILNSTSNFVLDQMSGGRSKKEAVAEAQRIGIAEAEPSLDLDGWDAAAKITALANVLMEADTTPGAVDRKGVGEISNADMEAARTQGKKIKLIATAGREDGRIKLKVQPVRIGSDHPFWSVDGTSSALTLRTDLMGDITIIERGPGITQTAYALFSDLLLTVESIRNGTL
jgi:homoserine dehydrogenase